MPSVFVPRRSGVHRIAGVALLRALLVQCRLQAYGNKELQNIVRNRFKSNQHLQSPRLIANAFKAGYEALDILARSVAGDEKSHSTLQHLIGYLPDRLKTSAQQKPIPRSIHRTNTESFSPLLVPPNNPKTVGVVLPVASEHSILLRPHLKVNGKRHVPVWTRAHGIPFLRIQKPQPQALSAFIKWRVERRQKRIDSRLMMEKKYVPIGEREDEWDDIIAQEFPGWDEDVVECLAAERRMSWSTEFRNSIIDYSEKLHVEGKKSAIISQEMLKVANAEQVLARQEQRRDKKTRKYARKQEIQLHQEHEKVLPFRRTEVLAVPSVED